MLMLLLIFLVVILLFLTVYTRRMLTEAEGQIVHQMNSNQRRGFMISFAGVLFLTFTVLASIGISIILILDAMNQGQDTLGYLVFFYLLPFGFIISVGLSAMISVLRKIKPSYYSQQPREVSKHQMIVGAIGLISFPFYYHFLKVGIHMTLIIYNWFMEFAYTLDKSGFHSGKLIIIPFIVGPILLLIGGLIGYYTNNNQANEKMNVEELE